MGYIRELLSNAKLRYGEVPGEEVVVVEEGTNASITGTLTVPTNVVADILVKYRGVNPVSEAFLTLLGMQKKLPEDIQIVLIAQPVTRDVYAALQTERIECDLDKLAEVEVVKGGKDVESVGGVEGEKGVDEAGGVDSGKDVDDAGGVDDVGVDGVGDVGDVVDIRDAIGIETNSGMSDEENVENSGADELDEVEEDSSVDGVVSSGNDNDDADDNSDSNEDDGSSDYIGSAPWWDSIVSEVDEDVDSAEDVEDEECVEDIWGVGDSMEPKSIVNVEDVEDVGDDESGDNVKGLIDSKTGEDIESVEDIEESIYSEDLEDVVCAGGVEGAKAERVGDISDAESIVSGIGITNESVEEVGEYEEYLLSGDLSACGVEEYYDESHDSMFDFTGISSYIPPDERHMDDDVEDSEVTGVDTVDGGRSVGESVSADEVSNGAGGVEVGMVGSVGEVGEYDVVDNVNVTSNSADGMSVGEVGYGGCVGGVGNVGGIAGVVGVVENDDVDAINMTSNIADDIGVGEVMNVGGVVGVVGNDEVNDINMISNITGDMSVGEVGHVGGVGNVGGVGGVVGNDDVDAITMISNIADDKSMEDVDVVNEVSNIYSTSGIENDKYEDSAGSVGRIYKDITVREAGRVDGAEDAEDINGDNRLNDIDNVNKVPNIVSDDDYITSIRDSGGVRGLSSIKSMGRILHASDSVIEGIIGVGTVEGSSDCMGSKLGVDGGLSSLDAMLMQNGIMTDSIGKGSTVSGSKSTEVSEDAENGKDDDVKEETVVGDGGCGNTVQSNIAFVHDYRVVEGVKFNAIDIGYDSGDDDECDLDGDLGEPECYGLEDVEGVEDVEGEDVGSVGDVGDAGGIGDVGDIGDVENVGNIEGVGDAENVGNIENVGDVKDVKDSKDIGDIEDVGGAKSVKDIEDVGSIENIGNDAVDSGCTNIMSDVNCVDGDNLSNVESYDSNSVDSNTDSNIYSPGEEKLEIGGEVYNCGVDYLEKVLGTVSLIDGAIDKVGVKVLQERTRISVGSYCEWMVDIVQGINVHVVYQLDNDDKVKWNQLKRMCVSASSSGDISRVAKITKGLLEFIKDSCRVTSDMNRCCFAFYNYLQF